MNVTAYLGTVLLPLAAGTLLAWRFVDDGAPGRGPAALGLGLLLGLLLEALLLVSMDSLGIRLTRSAALLGAGLLVAATLAWSLPAFRARGAALAGRGSGALESLTAWERALLWGFAALIALRVGSVIAEALLRPLYPWDAAMHWATKARTWFHLQELAPFTDYRSWLHAETGAFYTDFHPDYPPVVPLLQVWSAIAVARWDEVNMNLAWPLLAIALPLLFYGFARQLAVRPVVAMGFTYLLLSLPLLDTHLALAGYADIILGSVYLAALLTIHLWLQRGERKHLLLAVILLFACAQVKNEGLVWAATGVVALVSPLLRGWWLAAAAVFAFCAALAIVLFLPRDFVIAGHSLDSVRFGFHWVYLRGLRVHWLATGSWHLFALLLLAIPAMAWVARRDLAPLGGLLWALGTALLLYLFLFSFTSYGNSALNMTGPGRIALHLVPSLMLLAMLLYEACACRLQTGLAIPAPRRHAPEALDRGTLRAAGNTAGNPLAPYRLSDR